MLSTIDTSYSMLEEIEREKEKDASNDCIIDSRRFFSYVCYFRFDDSWDIVRKKNILAVYLAVD